MKKKIIIIGGIVVIIIAAITVIFLMSNRKITISFDTDGAAKVESIKIKKGESIKLPDIKKAGFILDGWYLKENRVTNSTKYKKDETLKAKWISEKAETFKVTFNSNGGNKVESITVECGKELLLPENPKKTGYRFISWVDKNENPILNKALLSCNDITLSAKWGKEEEKEENTQKQTNNVEKEVDATGVNLNKSSVDLVLGKSEKLTATVTPSNAKDKTITWTSSDSSIISVDKDGNVSAKKIGKATITATTVNGKTASAVVYSDVSSINITATNEYISNYGGKSSATITVTTTPEVDDSLITWDAPDASGSTAAAYFKSTGKTATITARDVWGSNLSQVPVTVKVGRKTSNKIIIYVEPKLSITKSVNQLQMPTYEDIRVNSNIPVKWSITGSVNVKDIEKKDTYYIFQISIPGTAHSAMIYVEGKTNAGQTGKVTYKIVEPR